MHTKTKPYLIVIYGKDGCPMCVRLKQEVSELLADEQTQKLFDLDYQNLSTAEGMVAYAGAETINGQRIPALQIMKYQAETKTYVKMMDPRDETANPQKQPIFVPTYLQLQTEYGSSQPKITPEAVRELMDLAQQ